MQWKTDIDCINKYKKNNKWSLQIEKKTYAAMMVAYSSRCPHTIGPHGIKYNVIAPATNI